MPNEERMTVNERRKYLGLIKKRYLKESKLGRGSLLDEMERITGLHRKSLIRLMSGSLERKPRHKQRGRTYGPEVESGLIRKGDTLAEVAAQLDLDAAALRNTVSTYNGYCAAGKDPEFGKAAALLQALDTPPFYGALLYPGGPNTQGGPRRNAKAQIVDLSGNPIPRLYSSGELGSMYGIQYPGGGNVGECMAFGRIAGRNAAAEEPWE